MNKSGMKIPNKIQGDQLVEILARISDAFVALDNNWCYTYMNHQAGKILNRDPEQMIGKNMWAEFPESLGQPFHRACEKAMAEQRFIYMEDYYPLQDTWFENHIYPSLNGLTIYFKCITERKKEEAEKKENEEKYHSLFNQAGDGILIFSFDGTIHEFNNRAQIISGYTKEEFAKISLYDILVGEIFMVPEDQAVLQAGESITIYRQFKRKDGSLLEMEVTLKRLTDGKILGIGRDITERKKAEEQIKKHNKQLHNLAAHLQNIREEERSRIGREIHDELGQNLTVLKMIVSRLQSEKANEKEVGKTIIEVLDQIENNLDIIRKISHELRPVILEDLGLIDALEWHAEEFEKRTKIRTSFLTNKTELDLTADQSIGLFRIFQESLTNVARHSKASRVTGKLEVKNNKLVLTISDDGVGFDKMMMDSTRSLGILGMKERTFLMNGEYEIDSAPGKGTEVKVTVPLS